MGMLQQITFSLAKLMTIMHKAFTGDNILLNNGLRLVGFGTTLLTFLRIIDLLDGQIGLGRASFLFKSIFAFPEWKFEGHNNL